MAMLLGSILVGLGMLLMGLTLLRFWIGSVVEYQINLLDSIAGYVTGLVLILVGIGVLFIGRHTGRIEQYTITFDPDPGDPDRSIIIWIILAAVLLIAVFML